MTTEVLPYRVIVYGKDDEILYDRVHDEFELWKLAPGLSLRVRGLDIDAGAPNEAQQETRQDERPRAS